VDCGILFATGQGHITIVNYCIKIIVTVQPLDYLFYCLCDLSVFAYKRPRKFENRISSTHSTERKVLQTPYIPVPLDRWVCKFFRFAASACRHNVQSVIRSNHERPSQHLASHPGHAPTGWLPKGKLMEDLCWVISSFLCIQLRELDDSDHYARAHSFLKPLGLILHHELDRS
jgi:hypothetical protein